MKARFYIDFYPGGQFPPSSLIATTSPLAKVPTAKRLAFDVHISDDLFFEPDCIAAEVSRPELVPDHGDTP